LINIALVEGLQMQPKYAEGGKIREKVEEGVWCGAVRCGVVWSNLEELQ
jgi:hypothetical protein